MFRSALRVALLVGVVCGSLSAYAQLDRKNIYDASVLILGNQEVQADLKLNPSQKDRIQKAFSKYADEATKLLELYRKDRKNKDKYNAQLKTHQRVLMDASLSILSKTQKERLKQLGVQHFGPFCVKLPDLAKELKLTPDQLKRINAQIDGFEKYRDDMEAKQKATIQTVPKPKNKNDKKEVETYRKRLQQKMSDMMKADRPKLIAARTKAEQSIMNILSATQRKQFDAMKGKILPKSR